MQLLVKRSMFYEYRKKPSLLDSSVVKSVSICLALLLGGCETFSPKDATTPAEPATVSVTDSETQKTITLSPGKQVEFECDCPSPTANQICEDKPESEPVSLPACEPVKARSNEEKMIGDQLIIGRVENVFLADGMKFKARIDTGAGLTSLHAMDLIEFERDGKPWVRFTVQESTGNKQEVVERPVKRFINIKQLTGEPQRRPIVLMTINMGPLDERVEVTLTDRTGYLYEVLIGRNFLRDRAVVDVGKKFTTSAAK